MEMSRGVQERRRVGAEAAREAEAASEAEAAREMEAVREAGRLLAEMEVRKQHLPRIICSGGIPKEKTEMSRRVFLFRIFPYLFHGGEQEAGYSERDSFKLSFPVLYFSYK